MYRVSPAVAIAPSFPLPASPQAALQLARSPRISVMAIGGAHQFAHFVPVALELERRFPGAVTLFTGASRDRQTIAELAHSLDLPMTRIFELTLPPTIERCLPNSALKTIRLLRHARRIAASDLILCAERTSSLLCKAVRDLPPLFHIPHGAGDRAVGFERRFDRFDGVLVAGRKDRDRLVASGRVDPQACVVTGPIKLASYLRRGAPAPKLFANERPTLLYNPHFNASLSSFDAFAHRLIDAVLVDGRYNLVVAPHVRLGAKMSRACRSRWEARAVPGRIIIDMGSPRSSDMTYTAGADLYIGDVSSQVYEFLIRPRPCLFINAQNADWRDDENYAMWHFGEVIEAKRDPIPAIERAFTSHQAYAHWQRERMAYAIDGIACKPDGSPFLDTDPIAIAANYLEHAIADSASHRSIGAIATA